MPILLRNILLGLEEPEERLPELAAKRLGVAVDAVRNYAVVRRSMDARRRRGIHFAYHLEVALDEPPERERARLRRCRPNEAAWIDVEVPVEPAAGTCPMRHRPCIVGSGPAGMFAALRLAQFGYRPIVLERGRPVRRRHRDVLQRFYRHRDFDPDSNLLFGEGGAGTYSDGKLYTRVSDPLVETVLETFFHHGADPEILVNARPHIGSDMLPTICTRIRRRIESLGGDVRFECHMLDIRIEEPSGGATDSAPPLRGAGREAPAAGGGASPGAPRRVTALRVGDEWIETGPVILAIGHSARDTIRMLVQRGVRVASKPFQIGVRIEHPQALVDNWQYGTAAGHRRLAPAEYHVVAKGAAADQGDLFSFCMCPGGMILPTNESPGLIATNGASRAARGGPFANSGLVITMDPQQLGLDALAALDYQKGWEDMAFRATGGTYRVPAHRAADFLNGRPSDGALETSYPLGGRWTDVARLVPRSVVTALTRGLVSLEDKFPGFAGGDAIITAPETRASAPIRMLRDKGTRLAAGLDNLYPVGEGSGYAGGIVSAAIDGIRTADAIIQRYAPLDR